MRPFTFILPVVGAVTRDNNFKRVDFPAPFLPIIPSTSPCCTSKLISFSAHTYSYCPLLLMLSFFNEFSCPIIKVGSGKPRMLYHHRCISPFRVLVPIKPSL